MALAHVSRVNDWALRSFAYTSNRPLAFQRALKCLIHAPTVSMPRKATVLSHGALLFTASIASINFQHSAVFERPTQSSIFILGASGFLLLLIRAVIPKLSYDPSPALFRNGHSTNGSNDHPSTFAKGHKRQSSNIADVPRLLPSQLRRYIIFPIVLAILARVELFRMTLTDRQCGSSGFSGYIPLLLAIYDYWYIQRRRPPPNYLSDSDSDYDYDDDDNLEIQLFESPARYISPTFCLAIANCMAAWVLASPRSTYICPTSAFSHNNVVLFQLLSTMLDLFLILKVAKITLTLEPSLPLEDRISPRIISYIFFLTAATLSVDGLIGLIAHPIYQKWSLNMDRIYLGSLCSYTILFTMTVLASLHTLASFGPLHLSIYLLYICIYFSGINHALSDPSIAQSHSYLAIIIFLAFLLLGIILYLRIEYVSGTYGSWRPSQKLLPFVPLSAYTTVILMIIYFGWSLRRRYHVVPYHPIAGLMHDAEQNFSAWLDQASQSRTLIQAADNYQQRYSRSPPPGFDAWYRFATSKTSVVIDDYDAMIDDLLPFWGITPAEIRSRTREAISDPWNEAAPISIRNGVAELGFNFQPTHRWMTDGILSMVKDFVQYLPDMDLAFNLNDEPRVTIPYRHMQKFKLAGESAKSAAKTVNHRWSANRAKQWEGPETSHRPFGEWSTMNSFSEATIGCPPNSSSRHSVLWDSHLLSTACAAPHSQSGILIDWRLSGSPCHQPDLRNLHGLYLTPSAFKNTRKLIPIFSQSKVDGFSDILYPSPWNYIDKVTYHPKNKTHGDPPFKDKIDTLFWRGGASEGESRHGTWKGMLRQRFVHIANNISTSPRSADIPVLLPHRTRNGKMATQYLSTPIQTLNLSLDVGFVNRIERAWDNDERDQEREFGLHDAIDFQNHWKYRYLFDTDGAGFSGRFIPFLLSKSLPFRSGLFRTWYDSRLVAWAHFVPIDVRLHGLFSTLGYFMGTQGQEGSRTLKARVGMEARVTEAEKIAEAGRYWARMALRKEDMEVFMFRLLLEWGRLTDDARDEIGYNSTGEEGPGDGKTSARTGWVESAAGPA